MSAPEDTDNGGRRSSDQCYKRHQDWSETYYKTVIRPNMRLTIFTTLSAIGVVVLGGALFLTDAVVSSKAVLKIDYKHDKTQLSHTMENLQSKLNEIHLDLVAVKGDVKVFNVRAESIDTKLNLHLDSTNEK